MGHDVYNQLQGKTFRWWAFSSTTIQESKTKQFLGDGDRTLFSIDAIGVDISQLSAFPHEKEVILLPGTCLVVDPGVMVEHNKWEFQASVWGAAQQELQQRQQHSEANNEGGLYSLYIEYRKARRSASTLPDRDNSGKSIQHFQYTDLPHPDWEKIMSS